MAAEHLGVESLHVHLLPHPGVQHRQVDRPEHLANLHGRFGHGLSVGDVCRDFQHFARR